MTAEATEERHLTLTFVGAVAPAMLEDELVMKNWARLNIEPLITGRGVLGAVTYKVLEEKARGFIGDERSLVKASAPWYPDRTEHQR